MTHWYNFPLNVSCVVYGMPRKAVECDAVNEVRNLEEIVRRLIELR